MTQPPLIPAPAVQRQIVLPLSKAVEIAWQSIRLRLSRSLLVTSGIVLALAFLMSIRTSEAILDGMRQWVRDAPSTPTFIDYRERADQLKRRIAALETALRPAAARTTPTSVPVNVPRFDPKAALGAEFPELRKELGGLPGPDEGLILALTADPSLVPRLVDWVAAGRELKTLTAALSEPDALAVRMRANGVPTTPSEIRSGRVQTRWLLGLALLVAFAGILNAMLMSVTERFREIGTMKCLGALDGFIIKLFLIESLFQGVVGTAVGLAVGLALSLLSAAGTYGGVAFEHLPWGDIAFGAALCLAVGIGLTVAGALYPAWQAARMQPIEAMRADN